MFERVVHTDVDGIFDSIQDLVEKQFDAVKIEKGLSFKVHGTIEVNFDDECIVFKMLPS